MLTIVPTRTPPAPISSAAMKLALKPPCPQKEEDAAPGKGHSDPAHPWALCVPAGWTAQFFGNAHLVSR